MNGTWQMRFIETAKLKASFSKDPSTKVGAVAVNPETMIELSSGWNGFPRKIEDKHSRLNDRETKYHYTIHAEMNCIYNATYNGVSLRDSWLFVYGLPVCSRCALGVIQVGIDTVCCVIGDEQPMRNDKWIKEWEESKKLFDESGVNHILMGNFF